MKNTFLLLISIFSAFTINAQDSTKSDNGKFTFSGYIDTYYCANFNSPANRSNVGASGFARAFDQRSGQFTLGTVQAKMSYSYKSIEVVGDLVFGPHADLANYNNPISPVLVSVNGVLTPATSTAFAIKQAYINWKATDALTFTMGQFGTHIGYEVIDAPLNYHYSLSNLFTNGPFYHVGLKANYAFSDKASLMAGIVNGVDLFHDNNRSKGIIAQLFVSPASGWNVYVNGITTNDEAPTVAANGTVKETAGSYSLLDLVSTYQITPAFMFGINAATGTQSVSDGTKYVSKSWGGVALYTNYTISSGFSLGARYEKFDNTSGVRALLAKNGTGTDVSSLTVTGTFTVADGHLLIKPEFRSDSFKDKQFVDGDGKEVNSQATFTLAMIAKF